VNNKKGFVEVPGNIKLNTILCLFKKSTIWQMNPNILFAEKEMETIYFFKSVN